MNGGQLGSQLSQFERYPAIEKMFGQVRETFGMAEHNWRRSTGAVVLFILIRLCVPIKIKNFIKR